MSKSNFAPITPIRRGDALLGAIGPQLDRVPPATAQPAAPAATTPTVVADPLRPEAFVLRLSPDVFRQIDAAATRAGITMTVVIAQALQHAGFVVPPEDLRDRRKRRHRDARSV
jgi:hypothetical protein